MTRPYSQACENNKRPILAVIGQVFRAGERILEIGSGTGQHVRFFAEQLPVLTWLPSETEASFAVLEAGLEGETRANIEAPVLLDVSQERWPVPAVEGVFSANTLHIMGWPSVEHFFAGVAGVLEAGGHLCVYGPFKYDGEFTTASNADFDRWLKARDPQSGVRDFEAVEALARHAGLELLADHAMPANNQLLVWRKLA